MSRMPLNAPLGRGMRAWLDLLSTRCPPDRIEKAHAYVTVGSVVDIEVESGVLRGQVQGDVARPHAVELRIRPLDEGGMAEVREAVQARIGSTDALLQLLCPRASDLRAQCTCTDWSPLCEHGATLFLAFLDIHPSRRVDLLTFRGYAPDSDEVEAALAAIHRTPAAPRPAFGAPVRPAAAVAPAPRKRGRPRKVDRETLLLPFEGSSDEGAPERPSPSERAAAPRGSSADGVRPAASLPRETSTGRSPSMSGPTPSSDGSSSSGPASSRDGSPSTSGPTPSTDGSPSRSGPTPSTGRAPWTGAAPPSTSPAPAAPTPARSSAAPPTPARSSAAPPTMGPSSAASRSAAPPSAAASAPTSDDRADGAPANPLAGFWRPPELPSRLELPSAPASSMLDLLGPPPWSDPETARDVLGPLWDMVSTYARSLLPS